MVSLSNAVHHSWAVVIHFLHTSLTDRAMMSSFGFEALTFHAKAGFFPMDSFQKRHFILWLENLYCSNLSIADVNRYHQKQCSIAINHILEIIFQYIFIQVLIQQILKNACF